MDLEISPFRASSSDTMSVVHIPIIRENHHPYY